MNRRPRRRLTLGRETVRQLAGDDLERAHGGRIWPTLTTITTSNCLTGCDCQCTKARYESCC